MPTTTDDDLTTQRLSLLIGTMIGQISELLNSMQRVPMSHKMIYNGLKDIHQAAGLQIHEIFYT